MSGAPTPSVRRLYCGGHEPVFLLALSFSCGIVLANYLWRPPYVWLLLALAAMFGVVALGRRLPQAAFAFVMLACVPIGAFYLQAYDASRTTTPDLQWLADGETVVNVTAHVTREGRIGPSQYGGRQESVDVESEQFQADDYVLPARVGVRLSIFSKQSEEEEAEENGGDSPLRVYRYGERLLIPAKLRLPRNYRNPGAVDMTYYFASQGIRLTGSARGSAIEVLPGFTGSRFGQWRNAARTSVLRHIQQLWPGERGGLMEAILLGARRTFGREWKADFQRTGTYHLLVASGINVGILAFAFLWMLRKLPIPDSMATLLTIVFSWGYAFLADMGAPTVRATLMLNIYLLTRLLYRDRAGLNALGIAALGFLLVNPRSLFEASFQMTFLAVIAVAGIAVPVLKRTIYPLQNALRNLASPGIDYSLPRRVAQFRSDVLSLIRELIPALGWRASWFLVLGLAKALLAIGELLFISAVMQAAMALPMAWYFHRALTMSLPANAFALPIAGVLLPSAGSGVALSYASAWLAHIPAVIAAWCLDWLTGTVRLFGHLAISEVRVPTPAFAICILAAAALAIALVLVRQRAWIATLGFAALLASAVAIVMLPPEAQWQPGVLEVTAIDVGQGDSLFIVTPEGKTLLVDAGGIPGDSRSDFDVGEEVVSRYLWARGFSRLDAVALSHAHSDHMGGLGSIIANFRPQQFWYGMEAASAEFQNVIEAARQRNVQLRSYHAGDSFTFGGIAFRVLNPQPGWTGNERDQDDRSLVLRLQYGETSALLVGDSHKKIEKIMEDENPQADLLKIGHHGSMTSSSPEFLEAVKPRYAVVSAGFYNSFHHPRPEVMERYRKARVTTFRTDLAGAVTFYLDGRNVTAVRAPH